MPSNVANEELGNPIRVIFELVKNAVSVTSHGGMAGVQLAELNQLPSTGFVFQVATLAAGKTGRARATLSMSSMAVIEQTKRLAT
jgi:hypothetical protein